MENESLVRLANKETGPFAIKVTDKELIETLKHIILSHWQTIDDKNDFFPAPQPVSLERRDIYRLLDFEYLVCVKSDGMRFLMLCYKESSYMIDRAFKIYKVNINFNKKLYINGDLGCIIDGELVYNNKGVWQYVVHDCINSQSRDICDEFFPIRNSEITRILQEYWLLPNSEFKIIVKQFFTFKQLGLLHNLIVSKKLDHKTDGLIFTPKNRKIGSHTQYDLYKWKPKNLHTFDFKIIKNSEGIVAYANKNGIHTAYACAPRDSPEEKFFLNGLEKNCPDFVNNSIVECEYDHEKDIYIPVKIRDDKFHPNSFLTIQKTLVNIKENITIEELIELVKKI